MVETIHPKVHPMVKPLKHFYKDSLPSDSQHTSLTKQQREPCAVGSELYRWSEGCREERVVHSGEGNPGARTSRLPREGTDCDFQKKVHISLSGPGL